jgi:hypothetical protein
MNRLFGKSLPLLLAILSTCSYGQEVTAQGRSWPINYGYTPMRRSPPLKGYLVLTSGDTLEGYIKVFAFYAFYPILDTGTNRVQNIFFQNIASMRIYDSTPQGPYTDYVHLPNENFLWRLDGRKKDVAIYDDMLRPGVHHLIMLTPKARITLYKGRQWFEYYDKIDPLLIRFINERYKTGVSDGNFKSRGEIIDYILDKENSLFSQ